MYKAKLPKILSQCFPSPVCLSLSLPLPPSLSRPSPSLSSLSHSTLPGTINSVLEACSRRTRIVSIKESILIIAEAGDDREEC